MNKKLTETSMARNKRSFSQILSEEEKNRKELLKKEGYIVGEVFRTQLKYIRIKKGEKGLDDFAKNQKKWAENWT